MRGSIDAGQGPGPRAWFGRWLWLAGILLICRTGLGQKATDSLPGAKVKPATVALAPDDRSPIRVRYPKADALRDLQTDRNYRYDREAPPPENPFAKFWAWLQEWINQFLQSKAYENIWQYVLLVAIAGLVVYWLRKAEVLGVLFPGKTQPADLAYETLTEDIHTLDFGVAIDEAVSQRNYRLAVRLLYLQTLKRLTDAGLIDYKPDKTNRQYVHELSAPRQAGFEGLTRQFEFVWYGDFPVDETRFRAIQEQFYQFSRTEFIKHG